MPSLLHEGIVRLFQDCPELAVTLLRDVVGVPLPAYTELRIESADLGDIEPAARHADLVVLLAREVPVLGIVVEAQLQIDDDKRFSWPAYATNSARACAATSSCSSSPPTAPLRPGP